MRKPHLEPSVSRGSELYVDVDGQGYHIPYIPAEAKFDGTLNELKPFALTDTIEFIDALSFNLVMLCPAGRYLAMGVFVQSG